MNKYEKMYVDTYIISLFAFSGLLLEKNLLVGIGVLIIGLQFGWLFYKISVRLKINS